MSAIVCPWCQSEIYTEEGEAPETVCPVCDNELSGYRTLSYGLGEEEEAEEDDGYGGDEAQAPGAASEEERQELQAIGDQLESWEDDEEVYRFDVAVEKLLDRQELAPECPLCREPMLETGERLVDPAVFRARIPEGWSKPILEAPFSYVDYLCPSCFAVQSILADEHRHRVVGRLSGSENRSAPRRKG